MFMKKICTTEGEAIFHIPLKLYLTSQNDAVEQAAARRQRKQAFFG